MKRFLILAMLMISCGSDDTTPTDSCTPATCEAGQTRSDQWCEGCRLVDDECGGTFYCQASTCDPCQDGEYQEFGTCSDPSCVMRTDCGQTVMCASQAACVAAATCPDGGAPLQSCPAGGAGCLTYPTCGLPTYCVTLELCAKDACDPGELATTVLCDDASIKLPCREVSACGDSQTVQCVCGSDDLACNDEETYDTAPCTPGQQCREVTGCGITFYCKGNSI
jgi:hypothetical protein